MKFSTSLIVGALAATTQLVHAAPVDCDKIDKYTEQWFRDNIKHDPTPDQCLFYTRGLSKDAVATSKNSPLESIWGLWDKSQYNGDVHDKQNKMRCIFAKESDMRTYFKNMSKVMAERCGGVCTVMTPNVDPKKIPQDGIWGTVEQPELKAFRDAMHECSKIVATNPKRTEKKTIWTRDGKRSVEDEDVEEVVVDTDKRSPQEDDTDPQIETSGSAVVARDLPNGLPYTADQIAHWFDHINW